jgi:hypothetical protein
MGVSGISSPFGGLSRSSGQVPHVLLTRSPLGLHQCCHWMDPVRLACVRHAASVRPEPGSNSPLRSVTTQQAGRSLIRRAGTFPPVDGGSSTDPAPRQPTKLLPSLSVSALTWYDSSLPMVARTGFCDIDRSRRRSSAIPFSRCAAGTRSEGSVVPVAAPGPIGGAEGPQGRGLNLQSPR